MYPYLFYMKKVAFLSLIFGLFIAITSCSSVENDAKKAAELNKKSLDYVKENDLEKAEELYKESQEIVERYKNTDQSVDFQRIYTDCMHKEM